MVDKIEKSWIDPSFGKLEEVGGDGSGGWWKRTLGKPNGLVDAGETFVYNKTKYKLTDTDAGALDVFLKRVTGANDVDFVRNGSGGLEYLEYIVYKKGGDLRIIDRQGKKDIFFAEARETPQLGSIQAYYQSNFQSYVENADVTGAQNFKALYQGFYKSAEVYASEVADYRQDLDAFLANNSPNVGDVQSIVSRTNAYNSVAKNYYSSKNRFYGAKSTRQWENPDFESFRREYENKSSRIIEACDATAAQNLQTAFGLLDQSARLFAPKVQEYRDAAREYLSYENPTQQQTAEFQQKKAGYEQTKGLYVEAKRSFYAVNPVQNFERPDFISYKNKYDNKWVEYRNKCNSNQGRDFEESYNNLIRSAQRYVDDSDDFRSDLRSFLRRSQPNSGDFRSLKYRADDFEAISRQYENDRGRFDSLYFSSVPNLCAPPPSDDNTDDDPPPTTVPPVDNNTDDDPPPTTGGPAGDNNTDDDPPPM